MIREAIILAGGFGKRLKTVVDDVPKPMAKINNRPFLEYLLSYLDFWGVNHVVISVGYQKEIIIQHFGKNYKGIDIDYATEDEPLGTGGAVKNAMTCIKGSHTFVFNGDTFFEINLRRLSDFRRIKECDVCIILKFVDNTSRYGAIEYDEDNRIVNFVEKDENAEEGYVNGGVYYLNKNEFLNHNFPKQFSIEKDYFQKYYSEEPFYALRCFSYFRDIGTPEDFKLAQDEFKQLTY